MKKLLLFLLFAIVSYHRSMACNECGCGLSSMQLGLMPQYYSNYIGVRYHLRSFDTKHTSFGVAQNQQERFSGAELIFRTKLGNRLRLQVLLPYSALSQQVANKVLKQQGLGDLTIMLNSNLFNRNHINAAIKMRQHEVQFNLGVKLPTGKYRSLDLDGVVNPNMQLGSGSIDFFALASYRYRYEDWISFVEGSYRFNTVNDQRYRFGNRLMFNYRLHYWKSVGAFNIIPAIGIQQEFIDQDQEASIAQSVTGGIMTKALFGVDVNYKQFTFGTSFQAPIYQNVGKGNSHEKTQINVQLLFNF